MKDADSVPMAALTWWLNVTQIYNLIFLESEVQNGSLWAKMEVSAGLCSFGRL